MATKLQTPLHKLKLRSQKKDRIYREIWIVSNPKRICTFKYVVLDRDLNDAVVSFYELGQYDMEGVSDTEVFKLAKEFGRAISGVKA